MSYNSSRQKDIGRLSLNLLRVVREVMIQGSVTEAAKALNVSQPAVTQSVNRFEDLTGIKIPKYRGSQHEWIEGGDIQGIKNSIFQAVANIEEMLKITEGDHKRLPSLGISDCVGAHFSMTSTIYSEMESSYYINIARPLELVDLFKRGEVDIVFKPLFRQEVEAEFSTTVPVTFIRPRNFSEDLILDKSEVNLVMRTAACPLSSYLNEAIRKSQLNIKILGRVDNLFTAFQVSSQTQAWFPVPRFLLPALSNYFSYTEFEDLNVKVRYGLQYNDRKFPLSLAMDAFDVFDKLVKA